MIEQQAVTFDRPSPHATSKLMELCQSKALGIIDNHHAGIGNINADLDDRSRHKNINRIGRKSSHRLGLFTRIHATVQKANAEVG